MANAGHPRPCCAASPKPARLCARRRGTGSDGLLLNSSWPGLSQPSTKLNEVLVEIGPIGIGLQDEAHPPGARPMLQVALALDCRRDLVVSLDIASRVKPYRFVKPSINPSR